MIRQDEQTVLKLRELYTRYGYSRYKMNKFEEYDLYVANKDFLISNEIITFTDGSGRLLAMKPDVTLSIIKNTSDVGSDVQKVFYNENVYRVPEGKKTFSEIMQVGLECIGDLGEYEIAEVILLAAKSLSLISDEYLLDLSSMALIGDALAQSGLSSSIQETALQLLKSKNRHELVSLCEKEKVSKSSTQMLLTLIDCCGSPDAVIPSLKRVFGDNKALAELEVLCNVLQSNGYADKVNIDLSVGNDLKYYSGVVFKGYIKGIPQGVLSGGQYDKLLVKLGRKCKGIGFAVYTDLLEQLEEKNGSSGVDVFILHNKNCDTVGLIKVVEELASNKTVLSGTVIPTDKSIARIYRYENGEVTPIERLC